MDCALELINRANSISRTCRLLHLSCSRVHVLLKRSADWQDGRKARNNVRSQRADDELEGEIKDALTRFPSFGYKRVTAEVNRKRCQEEKSFVNTKRVYRVARER